MADDFETIFYIIFALVTIVGPALFRLFFKQKRGGTAAVPSEVPEPTIPETANMMDLPSTPVPTSPSISSALSSRPGMPAREGLVSMLDILQSRGNSLRSLCQYRKQSVFLETVEAICLKPIETLSAKVQHTDALAKMNPGTVSRYRDQIEQLNSRLTFFEQLLQERNGEDTLVFNGLDRVGTDCMFPLLVHSRRLELSFNHLLGLIHRDPPSGFPRGIRTVGVDDSVFGHIAAWPLVSEAIAHTLWRSTPGFSKRVTSEVGLPEPYAAMSYFLGTGRLTLGGVLAGWLPWIFSDVVAAVQMGPAYASTLNWRVNQLSSEGDVLKASVDDRAQVGEAPLLVRMYVVTTVLGAMDYKDLADEQWSSWYKQFSDEGAIRLSTSRFPDIPLPLEDVLGAVHPIVMKLLTQPLSAFGGFPISQIPGLAYTKQDDKRISVVLEKLVQGQHVELSPKLLVCAGVLAEVKHHQFASGIRKTTLKLLNSSFIKQSRKESSSEAFDSFRDAVSSPEFLVNAILLSAGVSKQRGGIHTIR